MNNKSVGSRLFRHHWIFSFPRVLRKVTLQHRDLSSRRNIFFFFHKLPSILSLVKTQRRRPLPSHHDVPKDPFRLRFALLCYAPLLRPRGCRAQPYDGNARTGRGRQRPSTFGPVGPRHAGKKKGLRARPMHPHPSCNLIQLTCWSIRILK